MSRIETESGRRVNKRRGGGGLRGLLSGKAVQKVGWHIEQQGGCKPGLGMNIRTVFSWCTDGGSHREPRSSR